MFGCRLLREMVQKSNQKHGHQDIAIQDREYFGREYLEKHAIKCIGVTNQKQSVTTTGQKDSPGNHRPTHPHPHNPWTWSGFRLRSAKPLPADSRNPSSQTRPRLVQGITQNQGLSHPHPFEVLSCKASPGWLGESLQVRGYTHTHTQTLDLQT